ncbi:hypothetical protein BBK82_00685 [Lentzea guizhouensis]|uniref:DUF2855 domain-containing protein n=1 Tax=Lentzea guizhouensis TaxID=1586287 RepID=A0A1B2HAR7_9PSEU|nr:DUF2855 family protein [Lentzea guizhouensis]ANZ34811.1 hypothetical protein BBK82_00685 [Lentzea guizhouensis]
MSAWTVFIDRTDLTRAEVLRHDVPAVSGGEALLRVDRVGLTANNVTYGVFGDAIGYWNFFPATAPRGIVPVWGFADVVESAVDGLPTGTRVYGYLPMSSHVVVRPSLDAGGFVDVSEHRTGLPSAYNRYFTTTGDPAYVAEHEDLQMLYRPLFYTSFLLADQLADNDHHGARSVVISSASSKTAFGTAVGLTRTHTVGLTSPRNAEFTRGLGCYDTVLTYDRITDLPRDPTAYLDFSGSPELRDALHDHLGAALVKDISIGLTHQDVRQDPRSEFFFAPSRMRDRIREWGPDGLATRFAAAWRSLTAQAAEQVRVEHREGPDALVAVWREVLGGGTRPDRAHVITC